MPNFSEISNGTKLLLAAGILLLIDTFLAWQKVSAKFGGVELASASQNAWHGFWGIIMCLALILLLVWVVLQVLNVKMNFELPITDAWLTLGLGVIVFAFALLKNLIDDYSHWPSYLGVVLAALVAVGAWLRAQELGGVTMARTGAETPPTDSTPPPPTQPDV
jgi:hypothetical protein